MLQTLWAFVMSLARWPDGAVIKVGNELRTQAVTAGINVLYDDTGRALFDSVGRELQDG